MIIEIIILSCFFSTHSASVYYFPLTDGTIIYLLPFTFHWQSINNVREIDNWQSKTAVTQSHGESPIFHLWKTRSRYNYDHSCWILLIWNFVTVEKVIFLWEMSVWWSNLILLIEGQVLHYILLQLVAKFLKRVLRELVILLYIFW